MIGHTLGPWTVIMEDHDISVDGEGWFEDQNVNGWVVVGNPDSPAMAVAVIDTGYKNSWDDGTLDANAALVAAAPDLLAALVKARASLATAIIAHSGGIFDHDSVSDHPAIAECDAAIARATPVSRTQEDGQ